MLFAVCSDRGAPGATTVALALAAARGRPSVVVEADPYGGDLAVRCRVDGDPLPPTPTVLGLGTGMPAGQMAEGEPRRLDLWRDGSNRLSALVRVVPGFLTAEQGATLRWASVAATVGSQVVPVFADLGRIHTGSPSMPVAAAADALVTVCRGDVASVQHLIWRLEQLVPAIAERNGRPPVVLPVVVARRRNGSHAASQVAELLAETRVGPTIARVGWLAWDPTAVAHLVEGEDPWQRPLRTSPLLKSARRVVGMLGRVTGLEYADPYTEAKHSRRTSTRNRRTDDMPAQQIATDGQGSDEMDTSVPAPRALTLKNPATSVNGSTNGLANRHVNGKGAEPSFAGLRRRPVDARDGGE